MKKLISSVLIIAGVALGTLFTSCKDNEEGNPITANPSSLEFDAGDASKKAAVISGAEGEITADADKDWIHTEVESTTVRVYVDVNPDATPRDGNVTIKAANGSTTIAVKQKEGTGASIIPYPTGIDFTAIVKEKDRNKKIHLTVTNVTNWEMKPVVSDWLNVSISGTNFIEVELLSDNVDPMERKIDIEITSSEIPATVVIPITQEASDIKFNVTPGTMYVPYLDEFTTIVEVDTNLRNWDVTAGDSWFKVKRVDDTIVAEAIEEYTGRTVRESKILVTTPILSTPLEVPVKQNASPRWDDFKIGYFAGKGYGQLEASGWTQWTAEFRPNEDEHGLAIYVSNLFKSGYNVHISYGYKNDDVLRVDNNEVILTPDSNDDGAYGLFYALILDAKNKEYSLLNEFIPLWRAERRQMDFGLQFYREDKGEWLPICLGILAIKYNDKGERYWTEKVFTGLYSDFSLTFSGNSPSAAPMAGRNPMVIDKDEFNAELARGEWTAMKINADGSWSKL